MDLFELEAIIKLNIDDYMANVNKASGEGKSLADSVGNGLASAAKVGTAAITAAAGAVAALTTKAVQNYSEYEQLVGGVETLFGEGYRNVEDYAQKMGVSVEQAFKDIPPISEDAYRQVLTNADNAFETAGMSANQYMETVTSFSASLLSSLGGDTNEAAKVADMAVTDMADNVNKMGSSMESVQNAFQGFAKGNYTMLRCLAA